MKELKRRIISGLLSVFMLLSTVLGLLPGSLTVVQAADNGREDLMTIQHLQNINQIDPDFDSNTDAKPVTFGDFDSFSTNFANELSETPFLGEHAIVVVQKVDEPTRDGALPWIMYHHVAENSVTGDQYDLKVTLTGYQKHNYRSISKETGLEIPPFFAAGKQTIGFWTETLRNVTCKFEWYVSTGAKTNRRMTSQEKAKFRSYFTLNDLDAAQGFDIQKQNGLKGLYKYNVGGHENHLYQVVSSTVRTVNEKQYALGELYPWYRGAIVADEVSTNNEDEWGWVMGYMKGSDNFTLTFYDNWQRFTRTKDFPAEMMYPDMTPFAIHYGFTAQPMFSYVYDETGYGFAKRVGEKGVSWEDALDAVDKNAAFEIHDYEDFDYLIKAGSPEYRVNSYEISDTLEDCLTIKDTQHVTIIDKNGKNISKNFNISIDGQTVRCTPTEEYRLGGDFARQGQYFTVRLTVHRKKTENVKDFMAPWMASNGYTFHVPNMALLRFDDDTNGTQQFETNITWIRDDIESRLIMEKDAKYDGWKVGDEVSYAVEVTQIKQDGYATNVVITDQDIPDSLKLLNNQWKVSGPGSGIIPSMSSLGENGWILTCPLLQFNESIKIEFKCIATENANGKDLINTAKATADNFCDGTGKKAYVSDSAEIWVNSPVLTVDKTANAYEYEVGDTVKYTITVNNTADYTIAENVTVSDISLPDGLELQDDVSVDLGDAQESVGWPAADGSTTISRNARRNEVLVEPVTTPYGNKWTVKVKYLPSGYPLQVTFGCKAIQSVNGIESQNIVTAKADNFLSLDQAQVPQAAQDDAEVYVNTAAFTIEKTTPDYEWQTGDHIPFDIVVKNINDEDTLGLADDPSYAFLPEEEKAKIGAKGRTVARNVVISDLDIPEGFRLDFDSVQVVSEEEAAVMKELEDSLGVSAQNGTVEDEISQYLDEMITDDASSGQVSIEDEVNRLLDTMDGEECLPQEEIMTDDIEIPEALSEVEMSSMEGREPTPASAFIVSGIPEIFEEHIPGTTDLTNDVNQNIWNETEIKEISHEITQVGNGWQIKISNLPAGNNVKIHFTCEALQAGNGAEGVNIGTVTAENAISKSDDCEAYINSVALSMDKQIVNKYFAGGTEDMQDGREPYEFRVGEEVEYRLVVNNNQKGSIARNVLISDTSIPEGLILDEASIMVEGLPDTYRNPVCGEADPENQLDSDHYKEVSVEPVLANTELVNNGFQITIDNLPCTTGDTLNNLNTPIVVTYRCIADESINGDVVVNTAAVKADNASEVKDSERIWINSPVLDVVKKSDREKYMVGDTVTYQIDIDQTQTGCVARSITLEDLMDTAGVKLQKNSIVLIDQDGNVFRPERIDAAGQSFTVHTGIDLVKAHGYMNIDLGSGNPGGTEVGDYNPLKLERESHLTLEYAAEVIDTDLAGQRIHNTVTANSKENIPKTAEAEVPVYGPALDIVKESDKTQYQIGEEAQYKLTVRELRDNITAKQVVITDSFCQEGMKISKINVRLNGRNLESARIDQTADHSFTVYTGTDLTIEDKLEVFYSVVFTDPKLNGKNMINIATAKGENTEEETQDNCVRIVDHVPGLEIRKSSDKEFYKAGETGHYTVVVRNTEKDTTARNVIIKDQIETEGAKIVRDSVVIKNDKGRGMDDAEIETSEYRYAIYTGHDLAYREEFTVTYDVLFESEALAGKDILNIARATCDNLYVETKPSDPVELGNGLVVYKYSDPETGSVVKNGDEITYSINVQNTSSKEIENILIKDAVPEYMEYVSCEDQGGVVAETRELDGIFYATFVIDSLPAGAEKTVAFHVKVKDAPQEKMLVNIAQVRTTRFALEDMTDDTWKHESFRNSNETVHYTDTRWVKDEHIVHIDPGKLSIDKSSDKTNYAVGETGHYTIAVGQKVTGAIARNVVVSDTISKSGAKIQKDSISAYIQRYGEQKEKELEDITVDAEDYSYVVYTNTNLGYGDRIYIRYDVFFEETALEGRQIKNVAAARDDSTPEGEEPFDDNRVTVGEAALLIKKTSDKEHYNVGDTGRYKLEVTTSDPARTVENVVVKDVMKQQGAHLVTGTVRTYFDNEELKVRVEEHDNGFVINTGQKLSGTHVIRIEYDVVFEAENLNGKNVENIATAWGDNTVPSDDEHTVRVGSNSSSGQPDKPDRPDTPEQPGQDTPDQPDTPSDPVKGMTLTKTANKSEVSVGGSVSYTLEAKVNSGKETAKEVVIRDTLDPEYFEHMEINSGSLCSYIDNAELHGAELNISSTGFTLKTGKDLAPGQVLKVTYDVLLKDHSLKGKTLKNTAEVSASNMDPSKDKESVYVTPDAQPGNSLDIVKTANKVQAAAGETVGYTLTVKVNSDENAENVTVRDAFEQTGVEIVADSICIRLDNSEFRPEKIGAESTGFTVHTGRDLAPGQVMRVTYDAVIKDPLLAGKNLKNTAFAEADNMDPVKDTEIISVVENVSTPGGVNLVKSVDKHTADIGDTVTYTLTAKTTSSETAKNVVIKDTLDTDKASIVRDSIRTYMDDAAFTPSKLNVSGNSFTITTGKDLVEKQILKIVYQVRLEDEALSGMKVGNTAVLTAENMEPARDNMVIDVNKPVENPDKPEQTPQLSITKAADVSETSIGRSIGYTLTVVQTQEGLTAENVIIRDCFDTTGVRIGGIQVTLDGKSVPAKLTKEDNGFTADTGIKLPYGSVLKVSYAASVTDESLAGRYVNNIAAAAADNAREVTANAVVYLKAQDVDPTVTPEPTQTSTPVPGTGGGDNTMYSIGPKTGLVNHAGVYVCIGVGIMVIAFITVFVMRRRKNK